jgi:hypothetical protein
MTLHDDATDAGFCWHHAQNPFEDAFAVLWELGVALAATESDDQGMTRQLYADYATQHPGEEDPCSLKFFPAPETRAGVLASGELPDALFGRLLAAYVDNACEYGPIGTQLCSDRERSNRQSNSSARSARWSSADTLNVAGTWSSGPTRSLP